MSETTNNKNRKGKTQDTSLEKYHVAETTASPMDQGLLYLHNEQFSRF